MDVVLCIFAIFLALAFAGVLYLIAADKTRFLARIDLQQWHEGDDLRSLPNFLQALHDNHFKTAWPAHHHAVAATYFRYRASSLLKRKPRHLRREFLNQHIVLFGLIEIMRPFIQDYVFEQQYRIVERRVQDMEDTIDRDVLVQFLESVRGHRSRFQRGLTPHDQQTLLAIVDRRLIPMLRSTHAIFQEHGYNLLPEFSQLRRWQDMTGTELVQELPKVPELRASETPSPARTHS